MVKKLYRVEIDLDISFSPVENPYRWKILGLDDLNRIHILDSGYSKSALEAFNDTYEKYQNYEERVNNYEDH